MEKYTGLSIKYLLYQKKRTLLTVLGVALSSGLLFLILTLYFSNFINNRNAIRKEADYEMVFLDATSEDVSQIVAKDYVKSAYSGSYYNEFDNTYTEDALFVNVQNPYRINHYFEQITNEYGVDGYINERLASYYLQGDIGNTNYIIFIMFLLLSFIFAIIGVGIIRNTIQLNTIEQIKDYGVMRCIGATDSEIKNVIFRMGFIQELFGIACGMIIGYLAAVIIGSISHIKVGIHLIAVAYVFVVFIGDMYFVMRENSKLVKKISPIEAVRGNLTGKTGKLKARKKNLFGLLFGFEGDYAYKSLMGNKNRFVKTVASLAFGVAAFTIISMFYMSYSRANQSIIDQFGEYQLFFCEGVSGMKDVEQAKSCLPGEDELELIARLPYVEDVKAVYTAKLNAAFPDEVYQHYDEKFLNETYDGNYIKSYIEGNKKTSDIQRAIIAGVDVVGYDEEEYKSYEKWLVEGTLDVSENGLVLVKNIKTYPADEDDEAEIFVTNETTKKDYSISDYKVGDEITLLDMSKLNELFKKKSSADADNEKRLAIYVECCKEAAEKGYYKTYTIEGIVECEKDGIYNSLMIPVIVPLENYKNMVGSDSDSIATGVKYKLNDYNIDSDSMQQILGITTDCTECNASYAIYDLYVMSGTIKILRYIIVFVIFVVVVSSLNIINTSASNLYIRRRELAQLRVIGNSIKGICRMVVLEGVITSIIANVIGIGFAVIAIGLVKNAFSYLFGVYFVYPVYAMVIGLVYTTAVLCLSLYIPIKKMGTDLLDDLR